MFLSFPPSQRKYSQFRKASLDSHAVAKEIGNNNPPSSVAHAAGQAVATAHVPTHAIGGAIYALQAIYRANSGTESDDAVLKERNWQHQHLLRLKTESTVINANKKL